MNPSADLLHMNDGQGNAQVLAQGQKCGEVRESSTVTGPTTTITHKDKGSPDGPFDLSSAVSLVAGAPPNGSAELSSNLKATSEEAG